MVNILITQNIVRPHLELTNFISTLSVNLNLIKTNDIHSIENIMLINNIDLFIFFIDLKTDNKDKMTNIAEKIRKHSHYLLTPIIFISYNTFNYEIVNIFKKVHFYDYVLLPQDEERLKLFLTKFIEYKESINIPTDITLNDNNYIKIKYKNTLYQILFSDIRFIEAINRTLVLYTKKGELTLTKRTLGEFCSELPNTFWRCHKSYIINKHYIEKVDLKNKYIYLLNSEEVVPIGKKFIDDSFSG